jgi:transcriptional regulator with XRE-family HTH domain
MTAEEFKAARKQLGMTVRQMADALRLSTTNGYRMIRRIESGEIAVSGPISVAVEAMLAGFVWVEDDMFEENEGERYFEEGF